MTMRSTEQAELFHVESPPVPKSPAPVVAESPKWSRYRAVNPHRCDDCMHLLYISNGHAPLSRQAKYRRAAGTDVRYFCLAHAQQRREDDKLPKLQGPRT